MQSYRVFACLSLVFALCSGAFAAEQKRSLPNIVLVMADDQGWGDMAYNGHPTVKTPNFDQAAAAGLRFDRFYAAAPVCSPTRASVMTGRHPNRMGVFKWGYPLRPQEKTLAEALQAVGYRTGHFGKWHLGSVRATSPANPGAHGFDYWLSAPNFYDNDPILSRLGKAEQLQGESSIIATDAALDWIKSKPASEQPFLAVVWFGSPHAPHRAAEEDRAHYADMPAKHQHFLGEVTGMDRAFGKLRDGLETLGVREDTILWYCSDNGALPGVGSSGGHRGKKGQIYEGGLLVPAILEWPAKIAAPRIIQQRCNTCDIYPTLLEVVGANVAKQPVLDGESLFPLIADAEQKHTVKQRGKPLGFWDFKAGGISTPSAAWMAELLAAQNAGNDLPPHVSSQKAAELPNPKYSASGFAGHAAWIQGDWKLHRIEGKGKTKWELYDLAADPNEAENLAESESARVEELRVPLEAWLASVVGSLNGDDYPAP